MKPEFVMLCVTSFFIFNTYHDGKCVKMLLTYKKQYQMIFYAIMGLGMYLLIKKNPQQGRNMLMHANNYVKYMPIDTNSRHLLNPIIDFTSSMNESPKQHIVQPHFNKRMMTSGKKSTKRSVSETKKKYVASRQDWKCSSCNSQLDHTFEVDHRIRLEYGGGNDVDNLVALCRNCHGKKTAKENMESDI